MNAFDDNLKNRAGDFRLEPRKEVWERVREELDSKKRKRRLVWFWWFFPLLLAGGGVWYLQGPFQEKSSQQVDNHADIVKVGEEGRAVISPETTALKQQQPVPETSKNLAAQDLPVFDQPVNKAINSHGNTPSTPSSSGKGAGFISRPPEDGFAGKEVKTASGTATGNTGISGDSMMVVAEIDPKGAPPLPQLDSFAPGSKGHEPETINHSDSTGKVAGSNTLQPQNDLAKKDSQLIAATSENAVAKDKKAGRGTWKILAGAGLHNHTGNGITPGKSMADNYSGGLSNNAGGGQANSTPTIEPADPGWGLMLGVERNQPFGNSKHWSWVAGLHYQYQTFGITTGSLKDSTLNYSTNRGNVSTLNYYKAGNTNNQTGSQHRVHLLAAVQWHFDKKQHWTWQNGFYGGTVLSSDYLIPQHYPLGWVPSKGLTKKGYTGLETGFIFQPARWGAGIFAQYNLSNSLNISGPAPQYWHGFELRIQYKISSTSLK